jgi:MinD-like ATPase involved in chromosome partitioning or flagellar assembly
MDDERPAPPMPIPLPPADATTDPYDGRRPMAPPADLFGDHPAPPGRVWGYVPPPVPHPRSVSEAADPAATTLQVPLGGPPLTRPLGVDDPTAEVPTVPPRAVPPRADAPPPAAVAPTVARPPVPTAPAPTPVPPAPAPPEAVPLEPEAPADPDAVAATLQRAVETPAPGPVALRGGLRTVSRGLTTLSAAKTVEAERSLVSAVRARRRESAVIAFVAGKGGVGTTTTAAGIGLTLAALRTDSSALVDLHRGPALLGRRLLGQGAPNVVAFAEALPDQDALAPARVKGAFGVVDAAPWRTPVTAQQAGTALQHLRSGHAFLLADIGNDHGEAGQAILERADGVVIVTTPSQDAVHSTRVVFERIRESDANLFGRLTVALVCLTGGQQRRVGQRFGDALGLARERIVTVPFDPVLAAGGPVDLATLRAGTREAYLRLAARMGTRA